MTHITNIPIRIEKEFCTPLLMRECVVCFFPGNVYCWMNLVQFSDLHEPIKMSQSIDGHIGNQNSNLPFTGFDMNIFISNEKKLFFASRSFFFLLLLLCCFVFKSNFGCAVYIFYLFFVVVLYCCNM